MTLFFEISGNNRFVPQKNEKEELSNCEEKLLTEQIAKNSRLNQNPSETKVLGEHWTQNLAELFGHPWLNRIAQSNPLSETVEMAKQLVPKNSVSHALLNQLSKFEEDLSVAKTKIEAVNVVKENQSRAEMERMVQAKLAVITTEASRILKEVRDVGIDKSYFIPFSYKEKGFTHTVFLEFIPKKNNKYDLNVWSAKPPALIRPESTGSAKKDHIFDMAEHQTIIVSDAMGKVDPMIQFKDIPEKEFFFNSDDRDRSDFFQALIEPPLLNKTMEINYLTKGILRNLWEYTEKRKAEDFQLPKKTVFQRLSGAWTLLKTICYHYLDAHKQQEYKKNKLDLMCNSLTEGWRHYEKSKNEKERNLLSECAEQFHVFVLNALQRGNITEDEALVYRTTAHDIIRRLDKIEIEEKANKAKLHSQLDIDKVALDQHQQTVQKVLAQINTTVSIEKNSTAMKTPLFQSVEFRDANTIAQKLEELSTKLSSFAPKLTQNQNRIPSVADKPQQSHPEYVLNQIEQVIKALPPPSVKQEGDFWEKLPEQEILPVLKSLGSILTTYHHTLSLNSHSSGIREKVTVGELYCVMHRLALLQDKKIKSTILSQFPIHFSHDQLDPMEMHFDPALFKRNENVKNYFKEWTKKKIGDFAYNDRYFTPTSSKYLGAIFAFNEGLTLANDSASCSRDAKLYEMLIVHVRRSNEHYLSGLTKVEDFMKDIQASNQTLTQIGFEHIAILRNTALVNQLLSTQQSGGPLTKRYVQSNSARGWEEKEDRLEWEVKQECSASNRYFFYSWRSVSLHENKKKASENTALALSQPASELVTQQISRKLLPNQENTQLVNKKVPDTWKGCAYSPRELALCLCEPTLSPFKLIDFFPLEILHKTEEQGLFETLFFRPYHYDFYRPLNHVDYTLEKDQHLLEHQERLHIAEVLKTPELRQKCERFIKEGLEYYVDLQPKSKPNVLGALFFARFATHLHLYGAFDATAILAKFDEWLKHPQLTTQDKSLIHLHRLYLLGNIPDSDPVVALESWIYFKSFPVKKALIPPYIENQAIRYAQSFIAKACDIPVKGWHDLLQGCLVNLGLVGKQEPLNVESAGVPVISANEKQWQLNLSTGQLFKNGLPVNTLSEQWGSDDITIFKTFFQQNPPATFQKVGKQVYFKSTHWGSIWLPKGHPRGAILRLIDGKWYKKTDPNVFKDTKLPKAVYQDSVLWVSTEAPKKAIINSAQSHYIIESNGALHPYHQPDHLLHKYSPEGSSLGLSEIEDSDYILVETSAQREILSYHLPLFNEKIVQNASGEWCFEKNPDYLIQNDKPTYLLGGISQYLLLKHRHSNTYQITVPGRPLHRAGQLGKDVSISKAHSGSSSFVFFDWDGTQPVPQKLEARIFLAYLYLGQKEYQQALDLIKSIEPSEELTQETLTYLNYILNYTQKRDHSAISTALSFKVASLLIMRKKAPQISNEMASRYLHSLKRIPVQYELSKKEESQIWSVFDVYRCHPSLARRVGQRQGSLVGKDQKMIVDFPENLSAFSFVPSKTNLHTLPQLDVGDWGRDNSQVEWHAGFLPDTLKDSEDLSVCQKPLLLTEDIGQVMPWKEFFYPAYLTAQKKASAERARLRFCLNLIENRDKDTNRWVQFTYLLHMFNNNPTQWEVPQTLAKAHTYHGSPSQSLVKQKWNFVQAMHESVTRHRDVKVLYERVQLDGLESQPSVKNSKRPALTGVANKVNEFKGKVVGNPVQKLFESYFGKEMPDIPEIDPARPIVYSDAILKDMSEEQFRDILKVEFAEFNEDYKAGIRHNHIVDKHLSVPLLKKNEIEGYNPQEIQKIIDESEKEAVALKVQLLNLAQKKSSEQDRMAREARSRQDLQMQDLYRLFSQANKERYKVANPNLSEEEIQTLYALTAQYMAAVRNARKLNGVLLKVQEIKTLSPTDELFHQRRKEIYDGLKPLYKDEEEPQLLFYEFISELNLRPAQVPLLRHMFKTNHAGRYLDCVVQFEPGGGKTSVFLAMLANAAAQPGRISAVIVPEEQLEPVKANFRKTQRQYFNQTVEVFHYTPEQMQKTEVIEEIVTRLEETEKEGSVALMTPQFVEFLWAINLKKSVELSDSNYATAAAKAFNLMLNKMDGLGDEIDQMLNLNYAVHITGGEVQHIRPDRVLLEEEVFRLMTSEKVMVKTKDKEASLHDFIGLQEGKQKNLNQDDLKLISEAVCTELAQNYSALRLKSHPEFHRSFVRYASDQMKPVLQDYLEKPKTYKDEIKALSAEDKQDLNFLRYVRKMSNGLRHEEREAADEIVLVRLMFKTLLPETFLLEAGRKHGLLDNDLRPFQAAGIPATTQFGYHYKKLVLWYQYMNQMPTEAAQFMEFAKKFSTRATQEVQKTKQPLLSTPSAQEFLNITGMTIDQIENKDAVQKVLKTINKDRTKKMRVNRELAIDKVTYFPYRYSANGLTLTSLLNTFRTFSGTPWNYLTYAARLANSVKLSEGTEGKILDRLFQREEKGVTPIHQVKSNDPKAILSQIIPNHLHKERIRGFLEAGAFFKEILNNDVPLHFWDFFNPQEKNAEKPVKWDVQAIFYLHHPGGSAPPMPYVLKMGNNGLERVPLDGTTKEDFLKIGVNPDNCFFLINEKGCTGLDVPQPLDAINLMTLDEQLLRRSLFQTMLRLRQYLTTQNVEPIIQESNTFPKLGDKAELHDLINLYVKNQAIELSKRIAESFQFQVDFAIEFQLVKKFVLDPVKNGKRLNAGHANTPQLSKLQKFKSFLRAEVKDALYQGHGALDRTVDTKDDLTGYIDTKLEQLKKVACHEEVYEAINDELTKIKNAIQASTKIVPKRSKSNMHELDQQAHILQETHTNVNTQTQTQMEQNILQQSKVYEAVSGGSAYNERALTGTEIQQFLTKVSLEGVEGIIAEDTAEIKKKGIVYNKRAISLHDALDETASKLTFKYDQPYKNVVKRNHFVSFNFLKTRDNILPIFHSEFKPFNQILAVKTAKKGWQFIELSQQEAASYQSYLKFNYSQHKNVWLLQPNGELYVTNPHQELPKDEEINDILIEANALNGNMSYLDTHEELAFDWIYRQSDYSEEGEHFEIRRRLVALKAAAKPTQRDLFSRSQLFNPNKAENQKAGARLLLTANQIKSLDSAEEIERLHRDQVNHLTPRHTYQKTPPVQFLSNNQIKWLRNKELVAELSSGQFNHLLPEQMAYISETQVVWIGKADTARIQALRHDLISKLPDDVQLTHLTIEQVQSIKDINTLKRLSREQLEHLTAEQVASLRDKEFIKGLPQAKWEFIGREQVKEGLIDDDIVPYLCTKEAIQALSVRQLALVEKDVRQAHISDAQLQLLDQYPGLIQDLDASLIARIHTKAVIELMDSSQLSHLSKDNDFKHIQERQIVDLADPKVLQKLSVEQVKYVNVQAISALKDAQLKWLGEGQIQKFDEVNRFQHLSREGFAYLTAEQLQLITTEEQMRILIPRVAPAQVKHLNATQVKYLPEALVKHVSDQHLTDLEPQQIKKLPDDKKKSLVAKMPLSQQLKQGPDLVKSYGSLGQRFVYSSYRCITGLLSFAFSAVLLFTPIFWFRNYFTGSIWRFFSNPCRHILNGV